MEWLGRARIAFTHAASPLNLRRKDGAITDLLKVCEASTPPCHLNPFLFNGHAQTIWTAAVKHGPPIHYRRAIMEADHGIYKGSFAVDFAVDPHPEQGAGLPPRTAYFHDGDFARMGSDDTRPMLIVLHGLSGGSHEIYLRHCIAPLVMDGGDWEVCVVNARGCANSEITSGVLFNARATWDVRQVVTWARRTFPNRPLFGVGFSLGANILTNYVGEEGATCLLKAAVAVANPFDLQVSSKVMQSRFFSKQVYLRVMGSSMKKLMMQHTEAMDRYTNLDLKSIQEKVTFLFEFDREVQCPTWGYPTVDAYYRDASSSDSVLAIRVPFLAIQALDDPIAIHEAIPYDEFRHNPYTVLCTTSLGGHLSWFELGGGRWHSQPVTNFLKKMASEIATVSPEPELNGEATGHGRPGVTFEAMRRKLEIQPS